MSQEPMMLDPWPRCPECDAPRSTRCPICGTAGADFPQSDMGFIWIPRPGDMPGAGACHCGKSGCGVSDKANQGQTLPAPDDDLPDDDLPDDDEPISESQRSPTMLICTTCDEPFIPEYPRLCEWCGHEFGDGFEVECGGLAAEDDEPLNGRIIAVLVGLLLLAVGLAGYFMFLIR